jgi:23S rRNA (cytidine1920-2'-O)/16S rRNA (cytidine1409-2'-O)-methyltransferase
MRPDADADELIREGLVLAGGRRVTDPDLEIPRGMSVEVLRATRPRGELKLRAAIAQFRVPVAGRIALDVGAAAGGFTCALLTAGAARVYAVDAGFG